MQEECVPVLFNWMWFGNQQSPEICEMYYYLAEEMIRGNPSDLSNTLRYDKVIFNAAGTHELNPALPNVYKWDAVNQIITGDLVVYVDDLRTLGFSLEHAWQIARQVAS